LHETRLKEKLEYLRGERAALDPNCIAYAILQIGYSKEPRGEAIETLVTYLDFRYPGIRYRDNVNDRITWLGDRYPAVAVLGGIGKPAEPSLTRALASGTNAMIRLHALTALGVIYKENATGLVTALTRASRTAPDTESSSRLFESAREAIKWCPDRNKHMCESALVDR
jgi:hypothetical protein